MNIVMEFSTDKDIRRTQLNSRWNPISMRYKWDDVRTTSLNVQDRATIVVIAHGNGSEIGNAKPGVVDVDAYDFLFYIQNNMEESCYPSDIYISTCGNGIAEFAANVRLAAKDNKIWEGTRIFGHSDPVSGDVPSPGTISWIEIYHGRLR